MSSPEKKARNRMCAATRSHAYASPGTGRNVGPAHRRDTGPKANSRRALAHAGVPAFWHVPQNRCPRITPRDCHRSPNTRVIHLASRYILRGGGSLVG